MPAHWRWPERQDLCVHWELKAPKMLTQDFLHNFCPHSSRPNRAGHIKAASSQAVSCSVSRHHFIRAGIGHRAARKTFRHMCAICAARINRDIELSETSSPCAPLNPTRPYTCSSARPASRHQAPKAIAEGRRSPGESAGRPSSVSREVLCSRHGP